MKGGKKMIVEYTFDSIFSGRFQETVEIPNGDATDKFIKDWAIKHYRIYWDKNCHYRIVDNDR